MVQSFIFGKMSQKILNAKAFRIFTINFSLFTKFVFGIFTFFVIDWIALNIY